LSPGQRQKLVMARVFYHKPHVVVLDEITSHVYTQSEEVIYKMCQERGILMLSVGHRNSLRKYHQRVLKVQGKKLVDATLHSKSYDNDENQL